MKVFIILIVIVGIAAVVGTIIVGSRSFDGLVVDKPYDRGLQWDQEQRDLIESGLRTEITGKTLQVGVNDITAVVLSKKGEPLKEKHLTIRVSRPSTARYDRMYQAERKQNGQFIARGVSLPLSGAWDIDILVGYEGRQLAFRHRIFAEQ